MIANPLQFTFSKTTIVHRSFLFFIEQKSIKTLVPKPREIFDSFLSRPLQRSGVFCSS